MPARYVRRNRLWRIVEPSGRVMRNESGTPVDGGGHASENAAQRQSRAINARMYGPGQVGGGGSSTGNGATGNFRRGATGDYGYRGPRLPSDEGVRG